MNVLVLYWKYIVAHLKKAVEYRYSFFMGIFIQIISYATTYIGMWILLEKFKALGTWNYWEAMFLFNMNLCSYGMAGLFLWQPMKYLEYRISKGEMDMFLTKPLHPLLHVVFSQFEHVFFGQISISIFMFVLCFKHLSIHATVANILLLACMILFAFLIQAAFFIMGGSLSFWFVKSGAFVDTFVYGIRRFIGYPISIYHGSIQLFLTFLVPYAFVNYYPSVLFLHKESDLIFSNVFMYCTPIVGVGLFILSICIWNLGMKQYNSSGS